MSVRGSRLGLTAVKQKRISIARSDRDGAANKFYALAKQAQHEVDANSPLAVLIHRPGHVSRARLRGEIREAQAQVDRARAVVDALVNCQTVLDAEVEE